MFRQYYITKQSDNNNNIFLMYIIMIVLNIIEKDVLKMERLLKQ